MNGKAEPIQEEYHEAMKKVARLIDSMFNGEKKGEERTTGFCLLVFPFGDGPLGRMNYLSNANREDMIKALKEFINTAEADA